jgi:hypothetical protein
MMGASSWVHLDFVLIHAETPKALLVEFASDDAPGPLWVPKSQVADAGDYSRGDRDGTIPVSEWFANQEGLG